jgi:Aspartyl protease/PDZ domain
MIRKTTLAFALLLLFGTVRSQQLGFYMAEGKTKVRIPIEITNNLIVVPVMLNGKLPLKFILDTGVRTTILTEKAFSDFLQLTYAKKYSIAGVGGSKMIDAYVANNVTIDIPGVHGEGHAILVLDRDYLELRNYLGTEVHGILGYELFSRFIVEIDYLGKTLTLMTPERFKPRRRLESVHITIEDTKPYFLGSVMLSDSTSILAKLLIDTGASHGLLLVPESDYRIKSPEKHFDSIIGRGLGGSITGQIGRVTDFQLGKYEMHHPIANFPDPNSYTDTLKSNHGVFRNGSIGGEILSRFTVTFDFSKEKVYLRKNANYHKEFHCNLSGLTLRAEGENLRTFEVTDVRTNSSGYKADIQKGDVIEEINGEPATVFTLNETSNLLNSRPGRKIILDIRRGGKKIRRELVLENQI